MRRFLFAAAALFVIASGALAAATVIPLTPGTWHIKYSPGMPTRPTAAPGGWSFNFPLGKLVPDQANGFVINHHVDYVLAAWTKPIAGSSISFTYQVTGNAPVWNFKTAPNNTCGGAPNFTAMIEHTGDGALTTPTWRWWAHPNVTLGLTAGAVTVTVPLDPAFWSDVYGVSGAAALGAFKDTLAHPGFIGLTFGGGCFAGHGVGVTGGNATFTLTDYHINP